MIRALHTASSGMNAQQMNIDNISNNMANVNTTGFKRSMMNFQDLVYQNLIQPGSASTEDTQKPVGLQLGLGTRPSSSTKVNIQGALLQTENPLDIAIEGEGYFQVSKPDGTIVYTRDGSFKIDGEGNMVTSDGFLIEPQVTFPEDATAVTVGMDGTITALSGGDTEPQVLGNITLARFANSAGLNAIGRNLFEETPASGIPVVGTPGEEGVGTLSSGFLEMSNVDVVKEMVEMIRAQRAYQINSRVIRGADEMLQTVTDIKR